MDARGQLVWDLPVRLFHWLLLLLVCVSWYCGEAGEMAWHMRSGTCILALLLFRIAWGFLGSTTARFSSFVKGPGAALAYARSLHSKSPVPMVGHNPLGGWMVVALLLLLLIQAGTGLFANDDIFTEGPLAHLVSKAASDQLTVIHKTNFNILLVLIALHVAAAFFYLFVKGDNLIRPMITGRKEIDANLSGLRFRSPLLAALVLAVSAAIVWLIVTKL